ncbi:MAG: HD domain-containing protein [Actinomycetia bacterium]|nr:HD domain-containing protein [Actinomycetes bacterium]
MADGTAADYRLIDTHEEQLSAGLADQVLGWLRMMDGPSPYRISRFDHSRQSATRAEADGADDETVFCALLHDIGDVLSPVNHSEVGAAVLRPYVSDRNYRIVKHHGLFQGYYWMHHYDRDRNERDRYAGHQWYDATVAFCHEWDQNCFDPNHPTKPLEYFEPLVREILGRTPVGYL